MKPVYVLVAALVLAVAAGFGAATALSVGQQQPTRTVTINVATGAQGPKGDPGPPGPPGPAATERCPAGYEFEALVINHPGGQTQIATCVKD